MRLSLDALFLVGVQSVAGAISPSDPRHDLLVIARCFTLMLSASSFNADVPDSSNEVTSFVAWLCKKMCLFHFIEELLLSPLNGTIEKMSVGATMFLPHFHA